MLKKFEERGGVIESITKDIKKIASRISEKILNRKQVRNFLQNNITNLAKDYNLKGEKEYRINNIESSKSCGFIDVVWLENSKPVAIFEIDSSLRIKSIKKLLSVVIPLRFWIYYGSRDVKSIFQKNNLNNLIQIVKLEGINILRNQKN